MKRPTKKLILESGISRFSRVGYKATTMEDLAGDVGIRPSALFKHFAGGKRDIFIAVIKQLAEKACNASAFDKEMTAEAYFRSQPEGLKLMIVAAAEDREDFQLVMEFFIAPISSQWNVSGFFQLAAAIIQDEVWPGVKAGAAA